jgi:hypothetical protein
MTITASLIWYTSRIWQITAAQKIKTEEKKFIDSTAEKKREISV